MPHSDSIESDSKLAPGENIDLPVGFGINLVAHVDANTGLGLTGRQKASLLIRHRVPLSILGIRHELDQIQPGWTLSSHIAQCVEDLKHPINVYVLPAIRLTTLFQNYPGLLVPGRLHVASFWWEMSRIPGPWLQQLSRFDGIIAESSFVAELVRNSLPMVPVIQVKHPVSVPDGTRGNRSKFGLPDDAIIFTVSLDPNSDPARKNPAAAVQAFRAAFPLSIGNAALVIRLNNADTAWGKETTRILMQLANGDPRIFLLTGAMGHDEVLSLYASSDVYVSLHRGEGLGLGLMEAMALGKPVIATGWSGNMSFMDSTCGCLVRYRHIAASGNYWFTQPGFVGPDAQWADPVMEDAVAWMRKLFEDKPYRLRIGRRAQERISSYQHEALGRMWIDEMIEIWRASKFLPRVVEKYSSITTPAS